MTISGDIYIYIYRALSRHRPHLNFEAVIQASTEAIFGEGSLRGVGDGVNGPWPVVAVVRVDLTKNPWRTVHHGKIHGKSTESIGEMKNISF